LRTNSLTSLRRGRRPQVDIAAALNFTVPGIVALQSALKGGASLSIPQFRSI
jgi:hypothetical protein